MSGYGSDGSTGGPQFPYVSKSPSGRNVSVRFDEAEDDTAPAKVTHELRGFPSTVFRHAPTLKTGKFAGAPIKFLDGAVACLANEPTQTYSDGEP